MIVSFSTLLALATLAVNSELGERATRAFVTSTSDESGNVFRDRARVAVHNVLTGREFANLHSDPYAVWRRVLAWIGGLFERLANAIRGLPPLLYWTVVTWMILTLVAILGHLIYTLVKLIRGTSRTMRATDGRGKIAGELLGIQDLDFDKVYAEARRLLAAGEWTAATRYFYVAAILWLDHEGAIVFKRSKTNCDYISELALGAGVPALAGFSAPTPPRGGTPTQPAKGLIPTSRAQGFRRLTELFEPIVYGGRAPTSSNMDDISTTVESLLHEPAVAGPR
jgi:hypothetical protein